MPLPAAVASHSHFLFPRVTPRALYSPICAASPGCPRRGPSPRPPAGAGDHEHTSTGGATMTTADEVVAEARSRAGWPTWATSASTTAPVACSTGGGHVQRASAPRCSVSGRGHPSSAPRGRGTVPGATRRSTSRSSPRCCFGLACPAPAPRPLSFLLAQGPRARLASRRLGGGGPGPAARPGHHDTDRHRPPPPVQMSLIDEMAPKFKSMLPTPRRPGLTERLPAPRPRLPLAGCSAPRATNRHHESWLASVRHGLGLRVPPPAGAQAPAVAVPGPGRGGSRRRRTWTRCPPCSPCTPRPVRDDPPRHRPGDPVRGDLLDATSEYSTGHHWPTTYG